MLELVIEKNGAQCASDEPVAVSLVWTTWRVRERAA